MELVLNWLSKESCGEIIYMCLCIAHKKIKLNNSLKRKKEVQLKNSRIRGTASTAICKKSLKYDLNSVKEQMKC